MGRGQHRAFPVLLSLHEVQEQPWLARILGLKVLITVGQNDQDRVNVCINIIMYKRMYKYNFFNPYFSWPQVPATFKRGEIDIPEFSPITLTQHQCGQISSQLDNVDVQKSVNTYVWNKSLQMKT